MKFYILILYLNSFILSLIYIGKEDESSPEFQDGSIQNPYNNISFGVNKSINSLNFSMSLNIILLSSDYGYEMIENYPENYSITISSSSKFKLNIIINKNALFSLTQSKILFSNRTFILNKSGSLTLIRIEIIFKNIPDVHHLFYVSSFFLLNITV